MANPSYAALLRAYADEDDLVANAGRSITPEGRERLHRRATQLRTLAALLDRVTEREAHFLVGVGVPMRAQGKTEIPAELERVAGILLSLAAGPQPEEGRDGE